MFNEILLSGIPGKMIVLNNQQFADRIGAVNVSDATALNTQVLKSLSPEHTVIGVRLEDLAMIPAETLAGYQSKGLSVVLYRTGSDGEIVVMKSIAALTRSELRNLLREDLPVTNEGFVDAEATAALGAMKVLIQMFLSEQSVAQAA